MTKYMKKNMKKIAAVLVLALCLSLGAGLAPEATVCAASSSTKKSSLERKTEQIVNRYVKPGSLKQTALKNLFQYVEKKCGYSRVVGFKDTKGWEKTYALQMLTKKKGSCYHFAAAYAFLAKKATGLPVRICIGKTNGFSGKWQAHAWVEVKISKNWYLFDPNLDKYMAKSSLKYYKRNITSKLYKSTYKVKKRITVSF